MCEPGRVGWVESGSVIVRVNLRKKQKLYINDGTYGSLFDAGVPNFVLPLKNDIVWKSDFKKTYCI